MPTVESFTVSLENFDAVLQADSPTRYVEAQILNRLANPVRLLRWAIVRVTPADDNRQFHCEGAYLKQ